MNDTPTVILDGEPVVFQGSAPPESIQELGRMLMAALDEQGRVLTRFYADGVSVFDNKLPEGAHYAKVKAESMPQRDFLLTQIQGQVPQLESLMKDATRLSESLLAEAWEISIQSAQKFVNELAPSIQIFEAAQHYFTSGIAGELEQKLSEVGAFLDSYTHCVENSDPGLLAEDVILHWGPWLQNLRILLTKKLIPELQAAS